MSKRQVTRILASLEESGELAIERSAGRLSHRYCLPLIVNGDNMSGLGAEKQAETNHDNSGATVTSEVVNHDILGINHDIAMSPEPITQEPSIEPSSSAAEPPAKKKREPDPFYEEFRIAFREKYACEYFDKKGDFVQLAGLKKSQNGTLAERWPIAVRNYFATSQSSHTLADLARRYATFQRSALNDRQRPEIDVKQNRRRTSSDDRSDAIDDTLRSIGFRGFSDVDDSGVNSRLQIAPVGGRGSRSDPK